MSENTLQKVGSVLWIGKPWILSSVAARSILIIVIAVVVFWLELSYSLATQTPFLGVPIMYWTGFALLLAWAFSLTHLLLLRASNTYVLRNDSLEVRYGILTSKSFVLSPSGFSDLEVIRTVSSRIVGMGDMIIRTQGERDVTMVRVRHPLRVADQIRQVMARPIVRLDRQQFEEEK